MHVTKQMYMEVMVNLKRCKSPRNVRPKNKKYNVQNIVVIFDLFSFSAHMHTHTWAGLFVLKKNSYHV